MLAGEIVPAAHEGGRAELVDVDHVVGHEPVTPEDEVEGAFALADPASSREENPHADDLEENAVDRGRFREKPVELAARLFEKTGRGEVGREQGHGSTLRRFDEEIRRRERPDDDGARQGTGEEPFGDLRLPRRILPAEVIHLGLAQDLDAPFPGREDLAGDRQPGFLDPASRDSPVHPVLPRQETEAQWRRALVPEGLHGDRHGPSFFAQARSSSSRRTCESPSAPSAARSRPRNR